jgi:hypothetical protein
MFKENLIVAVKANNRVLREFKDITYIPFGTEYKLFIKNLDTRRVQVRVSIDGTDATEGTSLVIDGNSEVEFERFIKKGNLKEGNKFKFIERTSNIEKHRGSKADDGIIRVEYQFEHIYQPVTTQTISTTWNNDWYYTSPTPPFGGYYQDNYSVYKGSPAPTSISGSSVTRGMMKSANINNVFNATATASIATDTSQLTMNSAQAQSLNDVGITVPGSHSTQEFKTTGWFPVESTKHVITLKLLGESPEGKKVAAPVTVKAKPTCTTCGRVNKATSKFCSECGTSLTIF